MGLKDINYCETPQEISNLTSLKEKIIQFKCGFKHTACLSINGKVNSWGNKGYGQLGHINTGYNLPSYINIEEKGKRLKIIQVTAEFWSSFF